MSTRKIKHSTALSMPQQYNTNTGYNDYGPTSFTVPGLDAQLSLAIDGWHFKGCLRWTQGRSHAVVEGSLRVEKAKNDFRFQKHNFPPDTTSDFYADLNGTRVFAQTTHCFVNNCEPADVAFEFPRTDERLWGNEALLSAASPYFKQLFLSSFAEGSATATSSPTNLPDYTFAESDDETDKISARKKPKKQDKDVGAPFKTVKVKDTAATTYRAVLVWLASRHLSFALLRSTFRKDGTSVANVTQARSTAVSNSAAAEPLLPAPASPKSVYRLAHLLELPDLCKLTLENLSSQLTPDNAAYELYSDVATCYPEVRDVVLEFVVEKWDEVKKAKATAVMKEKARAGELDAAAIETAMLLAEKLAEAA
ncbi:hypothetical protein JCM10207_004715 [Rhodosporidiobolus poonsookiae]